jgi:hypothetical protein
MPQRSRNSWSASLTKANGSSVERASTSSTLRVLAISAWSRRRWDLTRCGGVRASRPTAHAGSMSRCDRSVLSKLVDPGVMLS